MPRPGRVPWAHPRAVRTLLAAATVTAVGDQVAGVALALGAHARGDGGLLVSGLLVASLLPLVLLAPAAGWLADRVEASRILTGCGLAGAYLSLGLARTESSLLWLLGTGLLAAVAAFSAPALLLLLPHAAGRPAGRRALALAAVASRSSAATGPVIAAVLVSAGGTRLALLVNAVSYLGLVLGLRLARVRRPAVPQVVEARRGRASAGLRAIRADRVLSVVVGVLLVAILFVGISYVAVYFFVADVLGASSTGVGSVVAAYGGGMTLGCWLAGRLPVGRLARTAVTAPLVMGAGFLVPLVLPALALAVVGFGAAGLAAGTALTAMRGLIHERVPEHLLGRVWAAEAAMGASGELAALAAAGVLVTWAGPVPAMALCGVGTLSAGVVGSWLLRTRLAGGTPGPAEPAGPATADLPRLPRARTEAGSPAPLPAR